MKFKTQYERVSKSLDYDKVELESDVVPNCSLTVKEILTRFRRGTLPDDLVRDVHYDGVGDIDEIDTFGEVTDLTDLSDNSVKLQKIVDEIRDNHQNHDDINE